MKTIEELIEPFLSHCIYQRRLTEDTVRNYRFDMANFLKFLKSRQATLLYPHQVTKETLEEYLASMNLSYKAKTIKRKMASLHSFFTYLEDQGLIEDNPFRRFRLRVREGFRQPKSLSIRELDLLFRSAYRDERSRSAACLLQRLKEMQAPALHLITREFLWWRDMAILELLFAAGLRVAELCHLCITDYNSREHSVHIIGKGNRERFLFIENHEVVRLFEDYLFLRKALKNESPYLFLTRFGEPMSTQGVRNLVAKYAGEAGLEKHVTPHAFRHSFASLMLESGVDIKYIQEFLGHSSISTTQIYLHISDEEKKKILATKHPRRRLDGCSEPWPFPETKRSTDK